MGVYFRWGIYHKFVKLLCICTGQIAFHYVSNHCDFPFVCIMYQAVEAGKAVDVLSAQIEKRQAERADLETQLAREKMIRPVLTYDEVRFFFEKFKNGDANDHFFRTALIDTFVNRIYVFDGEDARVEIYCNASEQKISCPIGEPLKSSSMGQLARPARIERAAYRLGGGRSIP